MDPRHLKLPATGTARARIPVETSPSRGWRGVVDRVVRRYRRWRLRPGELEPGRWWNGSLRSLEQVSVAEERAAAARLPLQRNEARNWAAVETVELILAETDRTARIADLGLRSHAPLLDWLRLMGHGEVQPEAVLRVRMNRLLAGEIGYIDADERGRSPTPLSYDVVLCRSLPGDRMPLSDRLSQAERLLRPGGLLVLTTEYWNLPEAYQGPTRCARDYLCCRKSADALIRRALELDLLPVAPVYLGEQGVGTISGLPGATATPLKLAFRKGGHGPSA